MHKHDYDIVFVGGGLVNSLLAWQLRRLKPWLKFVVLERGVSLGGKHTWSFHEEDLSASSLKWLMPLISASWPCYQVAFPEIERQIESRYYSIRSRKFHEVLFRDLAESVRFGSEVISISQNQVVCKDESVFSGKWVFDGRGQANLEMKACGFQKFFGLEIETVHPHGLRAPVLMDATVEQKDGYRFMYCLPWSDHRLLVEDTRYSTTKNLDPEEYRQEILRYCESRNWGIREVFYEETGSLPLPLQRDFFLGERSAEEARETPLTLGMRAGLFHPTTGYSFPMAVKTVETLLNVHQEQEWPGALEAFTQNIYQDQVFFILLNRVMFLAAHPEKRYQFLQHFYRLPTDLIGKFYAHQMSAFDKVRFFLRTPPVSVLDAFKAVQRKVIYES